MKWNRTAELGMLVALAALAGAGFSGGARAASYASYQAGYLDECATEEEEEKDRGAARAFRDLAARVRSSGTAITVADLPEEMQSGLRKGGSHAKAWFGIMEVEEAVAKAKVSSNCEANWNAIAHAEVDMFQLRHEISEHPPHVNPGTDLVEHARGALLSLKPCVGDRDRDGIKDDVDRCPDTPEDRDGFEDEDGCPEPGPAGDRDGDGIKDDKDGCPDIKETVNGILDEDGCPDELKAVYFAVDSAALDGAAIDVLRANFLVLHDASSIRVRLEGNADDQAELGYNEALGMRRADAVRKYLTEVMEVPADRFQTTSWGEERPAADNATHAGRAANRRVEFVVLTR